MAKPGIIGGSGIDDKLDLSDVKREKMHTPYGAPSDLIMTGKMGGKEVVAVARHGANHRIMPSEVNYRANIWALKEMGVTHVIAATACGSLRETIEPGHLVIIDQFIDRTTKRKQTFYEGHAVCHISMSDPFCPNLRKLLMQSAAKLNIAHHSSGVMVTIEGPRFSSRAESKMFRSWGGDVINMTTVPEVVLAREAGLCYASIAMCTDYDSWHESREPVTLEMVMKTMSKNAANTNKIIADTMQNIQDDNCACRTAATNSFL